MSFTDTDQYGQPIDRQAAKLPDNVHVFGGIRVIASPMFIHTVPGRPVRYHRKKRIQKKWLKRYGRRYVEVPREDYLWMGRNTVVMHPNAVEKLKAEIEALAQA